MNKEQIQFLMSLVRHVIINLYGKQSLKMSAYMILDNTPYSPYYGSVYISIIPTSIWIEVEGLDLFKLKVVKGKVESIAKGRLNI
jgi:hypothetical protein